MSIIADTLHRLQTQSNRQNPDIAGHPSPATSTGRTQDPNGSSVSSRWKFWLIGISAVVGLSGLSLGAYWLGWNVDFGISTNASPQNTQNTPGSLPPLNTPHLDLHFVESVDLPVEGPVRDLRSSGPQQSANKLSTIHHAVTPEASLSPNTDNPLPAPRNRTVPVSSKVAIRSISPPSPPRLQSTLSRAASSSNRETASSLGKKQTETKTVLTAPPPTSSAISEPYGPKPAEFEIFDVTPPQDSREVILNKGLLRMEVYPSTLRQGMADIPLFPYTTKAQDTEEPPQITHPSISEQLSPINRLRQGQYLIQRGYYEQAVGVLSPLFEDPPVNWEPWFWMGTALLGQDHLEQADQFFLSGLARNDKIPHLWVQRALVAHQRGAYPLAIHELQRAESLDATLPQTHLNLGYAYEKLGNTRLANESYARFLKLSEGTPTFFSTRKKLYAHFTEQVLSSPSTGPPFSFPEFSQHTGQRALP